MPLQRNRVSQHGNKHPIPPRRAEWGVCLYMILQYICSINFCFLAYISACLKIVQSFLIAVGECTKHLTDNIIGKLFPALHAYVHDTFLEAGHNVCEMFC